MAALIAQIEISKGVYKTPYERALRNSPFAVNLVNTLIGPAGENIDRPSLASFGSLSSDEIIGLHMFNSLIIAVTSDRKVWSTNSTGLTTDITSVSLPGEDRAQFIDDGTSVYIAGGATPLVWTPGSTTALLTGSPPETTHLSFLDGYLIANRRSVAEKNKVMQFAAFEAPTSWSGINIFSANAEPDEIMGHTVCQRELYVVGEKTTEVWQNVGTYPVPFLRAFVFNFGTQSPYSILSHENLVFFLDSQRRVIQIAGRTPTYLSEAIDQELSTYGTVDDCFSSVFSWNGSTHILFTFPTEGKAWSIDLRNQQWSEWRGYGTNGWESPKIGALVYDSVEKRGYVGDPETGSIWKLQDDVKTDAGGAFKRMRTFSYYDGGASVRKKCNFLRFNVKRGVATAHSGTTSQTNPTMELRWRNEDGNWSDYRRADLGAIGTTKGYYTFRRLGQYRTRQYEYQLSDPSEVTVIGAESDDEVLTS